MNESTTANAHGSQAKLDVVALVELLKPITWFPPMWAFACGAISSGIPLLSNIWVILLGACLAGPLVCGASQVVNDWYDREVDAINEPHRPIPSGRVPGAIGFWFAVCWSLVSLIVASVLGVWVFVATLAGLVLAWAYSAPPTRLKKNGWYGNAAVGLSYEGLAWVTGAAVMLGGVLPDIRILSLALLYSVGAHGIMTLNDFKSINGDRKVGIRSLPATYGTGKAAKLACIFMAIPQVIVALLLFNWDLPLYALIVIMLLLAQFGAMAKLLQDPKERATWYSAVGVSFYVLGMMTSALALRTQFAL